MAKTKMVQIRVRPRCSLKHDNRTYTEGMELEVSEDRAKRFCDKRDPDNAAYYNPSPAASRV